MPEGISGVPKAGPQTLVFKPKESNPPPSYDSFKDSLLKVLSKDANGNKPIATA